MLETRTVRRAEQLHCTALAAEADDEVMRAKILEKMSADGFEPDTIRWATEEQLDFANGQLVRRMMATLYWLEPV